MSRTPTTTHVLGAERIPAMYQPGQQANLVPAEPLNPSPTQDMLPGMGDVRSGNAVTDNGLAPMANRHIHAQVVQANREAQAAKLDKAVEGLRQRMVSLSAEVDSLRAKGDRANSSVLQQKNQTLQQLKQRLIQAKHQRAMILGGARPLRGQRRHHHLPPWKRPGIFRWNRQWIGRDKHRMLRVQPMERVSAPVTPSALMYEPAGISYQKNRQKILAMQQNIQPVKPISVMNGMGFDAMEYVDKATAWTKSESFGIPNWMWMAGAGGVALLLALKGRSGGKALVIQ